MEVSYKISVDDYVEYCLHERWKSRWARRLFWWTWLGVTGMCLVIALLFFLCSNSGVEGMGNYAVIALALAVVCFVGFPYFSRKSLASQYATIARELESNGMFEGCKLVLNDESLISVTSGGASEFRWDKLQRIEESPNHASLMRTTVPAAFLSRRGFESDEIYERVIEFARQRIGRDGSDSRADQR